MAMESLMRILLFITSLPLITYAQLFDTGFLVNSRELGNDLLLFVPDSSVQIITNPARAAGYNKDFLYITRLNKSVRYFTTIPGWSSVSYRTTGTSGDAYWTPLLFSNINKELSGTSAINATLLFGEIGRKWLISVLNVDNNYDTNGFEDLSDTDVNTDLLRTTETQNESISGIHKISVNRIFTKDSVDFSIGILAGKGTYVYSRFNDLRSNRTNFLSSGQNNYIDNTTTLNKDKVENIVMGLKGDVSSKKWEVTSSVYFIKSSFKDNYKRDDLSLRTYYDSSNFPYEQRITDEHRLDKNQISSNAFGADAYYRKSFRLFNHQSDFFVASKVFYSSDNQRMESGYYGVQKIYTPDLDTTLVEDIGKHAKYNTISQSYNLRSGLIFRREIDDLYLLSGLTGSLTYSRRENKTFNLRDDQFLDGDLNFKEYYYLVELPVYINYSPTEWFEIYIGYHMTYIFQDYTISEDINEPVYVKLNRDKREEYANYDRTYLGINLKHKSGLRAQLGFNGSIASYEAWNFSLGYIF